MPGHIHLKAASCTQTADAALRPGFRQRRQQIDLAGMTLQQALCDGSRAAEVAVDLERRMGVQQIRVGRPRQQLLQILVCHPAVQESRPQIDDPCTAPARMTAAVDETADQCGTGSLAQFRRVIRRDEVCRIEGKQVRDMAVTDLHLFIVLRPLLDLTVLADLQRRQLFQQTFQLCGEVPVPVQQLAALDHVPEQHRQNFRIHKRTAAQTALCAALGFIGILRRDRRTSHQFAVLVLRQIVHEEQGSLTHCLIVLIQEVQVLSELVVFENVQTQPSRTHGPDGRRHPQILGCCVAPDVCVVVADKATAAVHRLGSLPSRRTHPLNQIEQRQVAFRQIADLCRPVVHLGVDVDGIAAAPSRPHILVPDALEIHGLCSRTAGGQHQISAVIEVQHCQLAVVDLELALLVVALVPTQPHEPFICGQLAAAFAVVRQGKAHPAELFLVFRQMAVQQFLIAAVCRIRGIHLCRILVLFPVVKACADAQQQGHFVRTLHFQRTAYSADSAAAKKMPFRLPVPPS